MDKKMSEQEMRDTEVPRANTIAELSDYIESLVQQEHDYGTCVYAMSMAATAAFNYVARRLGVTGFQASCADMDVLRRTRRITGPFMIVDGNKMLYPQYSIERDVREAMNEWAQWAGDEARKLLAQDNGRASPKVIKHWKGLAALAPQEK